VRHALPLIKKTSEQPETAQLCWRAETGKGVIRFLGQSALPDQEIVSMVWTARGRAPLPTSAPRLNGWLLELSAPPALRILVIVEDSEATAMKNTMITAMRERYRPGQLLNDLPKPPIDSPEWIFRRTQEKINNSIRRDIYRSSQDNPGVAFVSSALVAGCEKEQDYWDTEH
jgi:hypothetical protein